MPARRTSTLRFERGTLTLHPPPSSTAWAGIAEWDDRVERLRAPAWKYRALVEACRAQNIALEDQAGKFTPVTFSQAHLPTPYAHQRGTLEAWIAARRQGVTVLPTGSGKTVLATMAMARTGRSTMIVVPTLDLMQQWYSVLEQTFPGQQIGLLGGGSRDLSEVVVATYDSAHRIMEAEGNRWGLLIFDECHHLPGALYRLIAEQSIAPYRLGLTATLERSDGAHRDLEWLVGRVVYSARPEDLAGSALAPYTLETVRVTLSEEERTQYDAALEVRDAFLRSKNIPLSSRDWWTRFIRASNKSREGRGAMLAHRKLRRLAFATDAKLRTLDTILEAHRGDRTLIFTDDNEAVYTVSSAFLIPAITHQTPVKERHAILEAFRDGTYPAICASRVLNEGVDVPEASVAVVLSGTGSTREHIQRLGRILRPRPGKQAVLYEVVARDTVEERVSKRRKGEPNATRAERPVWEPKPSDPNRVSALGTTPVSADAPLDFNQLGRD